MIKRTLYFGNPAYLNMRNDQMQIKIPSLEKNQDLPETLKSEAITSIPIEDIGVVMLDHQQITITQALLDKLLENNTAVICCNQTHHPHGLFMPLCGNTLQAERFSSQLQASEPLKKQLWQQTIKAKIRNQAKLLESKGMAITNMLQWATDVKSGDTENHEARAAAYYWQHLFPPELGFTRQRDGFPPNNLLNYGYAIIRAVVARGLVGSGLLPTMGIHHHNRYNAYALADDIMEPYRPYCDKIVLHIMNSNMPYQQLTKEIKAQLLQIPAMDIHIDGQRSPLMIGLQRTTTSLVNCYTGEAKKIIYPEMEC